MSESQQTAVELFAKFSHKKCDAIDRDEQQRHSRPVELTEFAGTRGICQECRVASSGGRRGSSKRFAEPLRAIMTGFKTVRMR